ncbi:hypothetical protein VTL71DRAFT_569 [Oculimacula yallundae]|uniref:Uncharacterized protein n=1 Tax=Oculimacula yallundae TaxID=86028 RepID=A0ABR4D0G9_9HELO
MFVSLDGLVFLLIEDGSSPCARGFFPFSYNSFRMIATSIPSMPLSYLFHASSIPLHFHHASLAQIRSDHAAKHIRILNAITIPSLPGCSIMPPNRCHSYSRMPKIKKKKTRPR